MSTVPTRMFEGFDAASLAMLAQLPGWSRDDYAANRADLQKGLLDPAVALIVGVASRLSDELGSELTVIPKIGGSVSPLNRDLRFAADKTILYKEALLLTAWDGSDKKNSPMFWLRVGHDAIGFASGIGFDPARRQAWRSAVADDESGRRLVDALASVRRHPTFEVSGQERKSVPKPWGDDHPRADLLKHTSFQVRWYEPLPPTATLPRFVDFCADKLGELLGVHRWLKEYLTLNPA
jgi:uncharacterized protein (DUF2461 family)